MSINDYIYWQTKHKTGKTPDEIWEYEHPKVVRCKECIYWVPDQVGVVEQPYCTRLGFEELSGLDLRIGSPDHFCCFGERGKDE